MEHIYLKIRIDYCLEEILEVPEPYKDGGIIEIHSFLEIDRIAERLKECFMSYMGCVESFIHVENLNTLELHISDVWVE